jgi:hypothetical protein
VDIDRKKRTKTDWQQIVCVTARYSIRKIWFAVKDSFLPVLTNGQNTGMVFVLIYKQIANSADACSYKTGNKVGDQYGNNLDWCSSRVFQRQIFICTHNSDIKKVQDQLSKRLNV